MPKTSNLYKKFVSVLGIFCVDKYPKWVYNRNVPKMSNEGGEKMKYPNLEAERARHDMTIERLTEMLGVTRKTYYNWCAAGKIPMSKLEDMAKIFGVSIDYLLSN